MKSWYLVGPNRFEMLEDDEPVLKSGYLIAEVLVAQPSVTETNMVLCEGDSFGITERIEKGERVKLPGHELCARVIKVNPDSKFSVGDRVSSVSKISCGECEMCKAGHKRLCRHSGVLGVTEDTIFRERVLLAENGLALVPQALTDSEGATLQPVGDCVAAIESVDMKIGNTVAIFGAGCLGLNTMQTAKCSGAGLVIVADVREESLEIAKKLGADIVINAAKEDAVECIKAATDGIGADIVFEAAGGNPKKGLAGIVALVQSIAALRPEGKLFILAHYGSTIEFPIAAIRSAGKKVFTPVLARPDHLSHAARLIESGQIKVAPLITYVLDGIEKVGEAFEITGNKAKYGAIMPAQVVVKK